MAESLSLLEFVQKLFTDADLRTLFTQSPERALAQNGLQNVSTADVHDALILADDSQTADFSRHYDSHDAFHLSGPQVSLTAPPSHAPSHTSHEDGGDDHGGGDHEAAVQQLQTYITNNYNSTNIDNSINQQVDTHGGDFDQSIDVHPTNVTGAGAVGVGGDNHGPINTGAGGVAAGTANGPIVTGDGNQVGDGNVSGHGNVVGTGNAVGTGNVAGTGNQVVHGDGNTTSFGEGSAHSTTIGDGNTVNVDHGGVFGSGNTTTNTDSNNQTTDSHDTDPRVHVDDSFNTHDDHTITDSHDSETHTTVHDSGNDSSDSSTHDNHSTHDSHDTDLHL